MTMKICKWYTFEAAHDLPLHNGKCVRLHGHSYKLEVEIEGRVKLIQGDSDDGMVMDFAVLDEYVEREIIDLLDHTYLNDSSSVPVPRTTAELLCEAIAARLALRINIAAGIDYPGQFERRVSRVRLHETEKAYAEWTA